MHKPRVTFQVPPTENGEINPVLEGYVELDYEDGWIVVVVWAGRMRRCFNVKRSWVIKMDESSNYEYLLAYKCPSRENALVTVTAKSREDLNKLINDPDFDGKDIRVGRRYLQGALTFS